MNEMVRVKLNNYINENGVKVNFIANKLGWNYRNLVSFRTGKLTYSIKRLRKLDNFLDELNK